MTEEQTNWKPGAIVNGHILVDGEGWVPLAEHARRLRDAGAPPQSPPRSAASQPLFDPFTGERLRPDPAPAGAQLTLDDPLPPAATDVGQLSDPALTSHGSPSRNALLVIAGIIVLALLAAGVWYVVGPMARKSDAKKAEVACKQACAGHL
ncbi:MAG: hypothetical protein ABI776_11585 [Nocardioidaceae bacterium]